MTARTLIAGAVAGLVLVLAGVVQSGSAAPEDTAAVVRTRALELVDERGLVRASLQVEADGEVIFRLRDNTGALRVKLGANRAGSGLLLANGATEPGVHILSKNRGTILSLKNVGAPRRAFRAPRAR